DKLRGVAERGVEETANALADPGGQLLGRNPEQAGERHDRHAGQHEDQQRQLGPRMVHPRRQRHGEQQPCQRRLSQNASHQSHGPLLAKHPRFGRPFIDLGQCRHGHPWWYAKMRAKDVMSMEVATIDGKATLLEAVTLLINSQESALPVLDNDGSLVGIVSEFDLIRHVMGSDAGKLASFQSQLEKGGDLDDAYSHALKARVTTIMTTPVITAQEDSELQAVADLILAHQVQRIPILRGASLVGIVRRADLMKALLSRPDAGTPAATASSAVPDDQLRQAVVSAIRKVGVPVGGGFDVVARNGIVHLWGEVHDEVHHRLCRAATANVPGVKDISSHMQTMPRRPIAPRWR